MWVGENRGCHLVNLVLLHVVLTIGLVRFGQRRSCGFGVVWVFDCGHVPLAALHLAAYLPCPRLGVRGVAMLGGRPRACC